MTDTLIDETLTLRALVREAHAMARSKGWHDKPTNEDRVAALLALVHSEVSEALEALRSHGLDAPLTTVVAGGAKHGLVTALLAKHYGGNETPGTALTRPIDTITTQDHHALVTASMIKFYGTSTAPTVTATGWHLGEVRALLVKFYGTGGGASLREPLDTVTTKDRFGLVTVAGHDYLIADIGMRMLQPRELFAAQGFPPSYVIDPMIEVRRKSGALLRRPLSKTEQIALCGNSVCPDVAAAVVRANLAGAVLSSRRAA